MVNGPNSLKIYQSDRQKTVFAGNYNSEKNLQALKAKFEGKKYQYCLLKFKLKLHL